MADRDPTEFPSGTPAPRTILLVDDDREVQRYLSERFEREGWRVIGERDGDWALRAFDRRHVDAVILDILIPVVNGFQVAEKIRQHPRGADVGVIMLTGIYRGPRHRADAIAKYKLIDYMDKPIDGERVMQLLRSHFAGLPALAPVMTPPPAARAPSLVDERQRQEKKEVERAAREGASPPRKGDDDADLRGNLKRVSFPRLLAQLHREKRNGGLFLLRDKLKKIIYFQAGHPIFIKSNVLDECLGRVLVRERMISESECEESVKRMKQQGRQQGSVLIEMGVISPHNLRFGLELQLQIKLFDIFDWAEGEFVFRDDVPLPAEVIGLEMSAAQIVLEGIRRAYHYERLAQALRQHMDGYPELAEEPERRFQDLDLSPAEYALVHLMDGQTTLADVLSRAPSGLDAHGARALTLALLAMGVISMRERAARARTVPPLPSVVDEMGPADTAPSARPDLGSAGGNALGDAELAALLADRRNADPWRVLGLQPGSPPSDIDRAYGQLARELHPDRFRGRPESTLALAREAFTLATGAHTRLQADNRRAARKATSGGSGRAPRRSDAPVAPPPPLAPVEQLIEEATNPVAPTDDPAARALAADKLFKQGEARLRSRDFVQAEWLFRQASELREDMGQYMAFLGWSRFCAAGPIVTESIAYDAIALLERACELAPTLEHPHLFLGLVYSALDRPEMAEPELEKAVQSNPDSSEALRELRLIHAQRRPR